jgi:hypothetical protein
MDTILSSKSIVQLYGYSRHIVLHTGRQRQTQGIITETGSSGENVIILYLIF